MRVPKASRKWPSDDDLVADIFVNRATLRHDQFRDIGDKPIEKIEEAGLLKTLGNDGR